MSAPDPIRQAGEMLSNCAFNLAQRGGSVLTERDVRSLDESRRAWDAALAAKSAPADPPLPLYDALLIAKQAQRLSETARKFHLGQNLWVSDLAAAVTTLAKCVEAISAQVAPKSGEQTR